MQHNGSNISLGGPLLAVFLAAWPVAFATAKPLDAEACARLKLQRDALEQSGTREALKQAPAAAASRSRSDSAQQIRMLMDVEGQLRFRCYTDLPLPTLRPDLMVEVPDVVDGDAAAKAVGRKTAVAKRTKPAVVQPDAVAATGTPVPAKPKTAATSKDKSDLVPAPSEPAVKPAAKPRAKADDAFRPTGPVETTGRAMDKPVAAPAQ